MLEQIKFEYKSKSAAAFLQLAVWNAVNNHYRTVSAAVPLDVFAHGEAVVVRITAIDKAGNLSEAHEVEYIVDKLAPVAYSPEALYAGDCVIISWQSDLSEDLAGYRIYRAAGTGAYTLVGQLPAVAGRFDYAFTDYSIAVTQQQYTYRVETLDRVGNAASFYADAVTVPNRAMPRAVINCDAVMEVGVEYEIDAGQSTAPVGIVSYAFSFGDGATSGSKNAVHRYTQTGEYTIRLTVIDTYGNEASVEKAVQVRERTALGRVRIRVLDGNEKPVPQASVYFDLGEPNMVVRLTDANGYAIFTAEVGPHTVGCIIPNNEWLPSKKDILVTEGEMRDYSMTMINQPMIEGEFEIHRMTFDEIVAAGIDISKPENQYIVNIVVTLKYVKMSFYVDPGPGRIIGGDNFAYYGGIGYYAYPISIPGGGGSSTAEPGDPGYIPPNDRISIVVVEIPIGVSTLKEFFSVKLHIMNNASGEFSMLDNMITLNLPDGLTIMDTIVSEGSRVVQIPEIRGQTTETITWILRGDKIGEYWLSADYVGTLALFNERITTRFEAKDPIHVLGMQGLRLNVDFANELHDYGVYYNVALSNDSDREVYMPNLFTDDVPLKTVFRNALGVRTIIEELPMVLKPGESITRHYFKLAEYPPHMNPNGRWVLFEYYYEVGETYGLSIILTPRPVSYFFEGIVLGAKLKGAIKSYNPGAPTTIVLMKDSRGAHEAARIVIEGAPGIGVDEREFTFEDIEPGEYTMVITKPGHASFTVRDIIVGEGGLDLTLDSRDELRLMVMPCGDISGDGTINATDLGILWLAGNYNQRAADADNALCDLNGDGLINVTDLGILWLMSNFNRGAVVIDW